MFLGNGPCLWLCAGMIPTFLVMIAVHETGHFAAGKAVGFSFSRFTVGFLTLDWTGDQTKARLNTL